MSGFLIPLRKWALDTCPVSDYVYEVFENEKRVKVEDLDAYNPEAETLTVLPWEVIRTPAFISELAKRYDELNLGMFGAEWFLCDMIWTLNANLLNRNGELIDVEKIIPDHMLNPDSKADGEPDTQWYHDFLKYAYSPPRQNAQTRMKGRYSVLTLGIQAYDFSQK